MGLKKIFHISYRLPLDLFGLLGMGRNLKVEIGLYEVDGFGRFSIPLQQKYYNYVSPFTQSLGYINVLGINIPIPLYVTGVDLGKINLMHFIGKSKFFFIVFGE